MEPPQSSRVQCPPLQCRHGPKTVENSPPAGRQHMSHQVQLQYGPWPERPWRTSCLPSTTSRTKTPIRRFNAATARRPWRTARPRPVSMPTADKGFNAATARRPWRTSAREGVLDRWIGGCSASMRPRPEDRGERRDRGALHRQGAWQCLHAATARRPWRTFHLVLAASTLCLMGRFNAATARRPWRTYWNCPPEATQYAGFNAATARRPWRTNLYPRTPDSPGRSLRCGHGPKTVGRVTVYHWPVLMLQCGHGPKTVENIEYGLLIKPEDVCFNAATARRPWRTGSGVPPVK